MTENRTVPRSYLIAGALLSCWLGTFAALPGQAQELTSSSGSAAGPVGSTSSPSFLPSSQPPADCEDWEQKASAASGRGHDLVEEGARAEESGELDKAKKLFERAAREFEAAARAYDEAPEDCRRPAQADQEWSNAATAWTRAGNEQSSAAALARR